MTLAPKVSAVLVGAALLAGCVGVQAHKGAVIDAQLASAIQPGTDNKDSVAKTLGRPSFVGQFTPNDWYYVARETKQIAFRNPRVTQQTVVLVRFDQAGNVASVRKSGKEMVANVDPASRTTPTLGRKRSFFEDVFGNIGTLSSGGPTSGSPRQ